MKRLQQLTRPPVQVAPRLQLKSGEEHRGFLFHQDIPEGTWRAFHKNGMISPDGDIFVCEGIKEYNSETGYIEELFPESTVKDGEELLDDWSNVLNRLVWEN